MGRVYSKFPRGRVFKIERTHENFRVCYFENIPLVRLYNRTANYSTTIYINMNKLFSEFVFSLLVHTMSCQLTFLENLYCHHL